MLPPDDDVIDVAIAVRGASVRAGQVASNLAAEAIACSCYAERLARAATSVARLAERSRSLAAQVGDLSLRTDGDSDRLEQMAHAVIEFDELVDAIGGVAGDLRQGLPRGLDPAVLGTMAGALGAEAEVELTPIFETRTRADGDREQLPRTMLDRVWASIPARASGDGARASGHGGVV